MDASGSWELKSDKGNMEIAFATSFLDRKVSLAEPERFAELRARVELLAQSRRRKLGSNEIAFSPAPDPDSLASQ